MIVDHFSRIFDTMLADGMPKSEKLSTFVSPSLVTDDPAHYSLLQFQTASNIAECIFA